MSLMMHVRAASVVALVGASVFGQPTSNSPLDPPPNGMRRSDSTRHALLNATVHTRPGEVLEKATVVIEDGRIVDISAGGTPASGASLKSGAREWDCTGLHIYPAFVEPYLEIDVPRPGATDAGRHWNSAVTPERRAVDGPGLAESTAKELRELGFGTAVISPRGGNFRGTGSAVSLAKRADDVSLAKPPVYAEDLYEAVSFESSGGPESLAWQSYPSSEMGAIALVRQTLIDADWQAKAREAGSFSGSVNALDALRPGRRRGEAVSGPAASKDAPLMPLLMDCSDELDVLRAVKVATEFARRPMILGSGVEFRRLAAMAELKEVPLVLPVNFPEAPKMASVAEADGIELREMMTWEQAPTNLRRLRDQGLEVALTTAKLRNKGKFWENVRAAIRHGLAVDDAMAMVTTVPAKLMGVSNQVGTIAAGMRANLTVTDGDWFDPYGNTVTGAEKARKPKIRDVWIDGQRHEVTAAPGLKLEGVWDVAFDPAPPPAAGSFRVTMSFDEDNKLTMTKYTAVEGGKVDVKTVKPKEFKLEKNRLSLTFEHEPFGEPGVFIVQGAVEGDAIYGDFIRSSGVRMRFTATKRPAPAGLGEWRVIEYDGVAKAADARDQVRLSITRDAVTLVFTDDSGKRTVLKGEDVKVGPDEKKRMEAVVAGKPEDASDAAVSYKHDLEKLGGKGKTSDTLRVDPANPDVLIGEGELPKEEGQEAAVKHAFKLGRVTEDELAAERAGRRPVGVIGTWRLVLVDDDQKLVGPKPEEPKYIVVDEQGGVVLKGHDATGKAIETRAMTRVFEDGRLAYDVDTGLLDAAREMSTVKVEGRRLNDLMIGTMTGTDGKAHTWKACRVALWGDEPGDDDSDLIEAAMTPEGLGYPFGPYAVAAPPEQQSVVVKGATIWTSGPKGTIENGTLVVTDGKIAMVGGPDLAVKMPDGTVVIDATGKHVTPGLIDCHSHTGISRGVNEGGQAVTAEVRIGDVTNPDAISWYRQLAGGITTVNNLHGSANPIGGQNQVNKNRWGAVHPDDLHFEGAIPGIKFALGENVKQGNSPRPTTRYPRSRMGVETLIRDRFTAAKQYIEDFTFAGTQEKLSPEQRVEARASMERELAARERRVEELSEQRRLAAGKLAAPEAGSHDLVDAGSVDELRRIDEELAAAERGADEARMLVGMMKRVQLPFHRDLELEALAEIIEGKRLVHCHSYRQDEILMLCRVSEDFGFKVGTFQHILEGYKVADELAKHSGGGSGFSDWWAYKVEVQDAIPQGGPIMHEQGVVVSYNSDSDEMARRMNVEAGKAVKYSAGPDGKPTISPDEALKFVTLNPAKQLKIDNRVGSLELGKDADFVIWSGNPLSTMSKAEQTWIDGRRYFAIDQDQKSRERIVAERARLTQKILGGLAAGKSKKDDKEGGEAGASEGERPREGGGRRRRGPQDNSGSGAEPAFEQEELDRPPVDWWMRRQYMEMYLRGLPIDAARPGECGCYGF